MKAVAAVVYTTVTGNTTAKAVIIENLTLLPLSSQPKRTIRENPDSIELIRILIFMILNINNVETIVPL